MWVRASGVLKLTLGIFLNCSSLYLLKQSFSRKPRAHQSAGPLTWLFLGSPYLYLSSSGSAGATTSAWCLFGFWESKLWSSLLAH